MTETILVVDSNPTGLNLAAAIFRAEDYEPQMASSGERDLSMLVTLRPGVILVGLQLIGMVARRIREDPVVSNAPILALVGANGNDRNRVTEAAGFRGCIAKPLGASTEKTPTRKPADGEA